MNFPKLVFPKTRGSELVEAQKKSTFHWLTQLEIPFLRKVDTAKTSIAENISDNVSFLKCENLNNSSPKEKKNFIDAAKKTFLDKAGTYLKLSN